jgi:hypothetical protein
MIQIRTVKPGILVLRIESRVRAFNASKMCAMPTSQKIRRAGRNQAQSRTRPQKSRFQTENEGELSGAFGLPVPKKSKNPYGKRGNQPESLFRDKATNMIGSRSPMPNPTTLHVDPHTCMQALQLPHEASITARISW